MSSGAAEGDRGLGLRRRVRRRASRIERCVDPLLDPGPPCSLLKLLLLPRISLADTALRGDLAQRVLDHAAPRAVIGDCQTVASVAHCIKVVRAVV